MKTTTKIDFRVPDDIVVRIDADARREGVTRSAIARKILINHYDAVISE